MNIYFNIEKLEEKRCKEKISGSNLSRKITKSYGYKNFYFYLQQRGFTTNPEAAIGLIKWYGSMDCIKFAPRNFYELLKQGIPDNFKLPITDRLKIMNEIKSCFELKK